MSRLNVGNLFNENEDGAPVVSGISTFSSPHYFVPPSGSTAQRPQNPGEGMIRFNTDSGHLEYCLLYTSPSPRDYAASRMPSSA